MVTERLRSTTDSQWAGMTTAAMRRCVYCNNLIRWMVTYREGVVMCFDAAPVERALDAGDGWLPGRFKVSGVHKIVLAPLTMHPEIKQRRATQVLLPHRCPKAAVA